MPKKAKGEKIELLYDNKKVNKVKSKKKLTKKTNRKIPNKKDNIINLDNEIIIGLTPKQENRNKNNKKKNIHPRNSEKNNNVQKKKNNVKKVKKKSTFKKRIIKWTTISLLLITALVLFMLSDVFNIKQISVENNSKVSSEEIVKLSGLIIDENMFKTLNKKIKEGIKTNAYIDNVKINKNLNGTVNLYIEERVTSYMLQYENYYAYINSQGYVLEISDIKLEVPMIAGYKTSLENIQPGNRLNSEDLETLGTIIKIMQEANSKEIRDKITYIDVTNENDYIIKMDSEGKTIHLGNEKNLTEKFLWIVELLAQKKNVKGEMFLQDLGKIYFRDEV
ncbi:MAG: FtsQ-type POTRA domain-containing protein [Clostridiales bacterium]|nr:FtsQ-type POTRA domain-containing protein [Clostridiales bacterium]